MKSIVLLLSLSIAAVLCDTNFENLDIDKLLSNEEQRKAALACLMDEKPCGEFQGLKDTIPHLIKTKCGQCTPKQKAKYDHAQSLLFSKYPEDLNALMKKYSEK